MTFHKENENGRFLKFVPLTICPIDKDLIDKKLMTDDEIRYLNVYHKFVYVNLSKHYKGKKLSWLKECCKAL
ncbi:MAG: M24 family metallopeptidase C-terminal domain-containing protein [Lachnospiraceae bacterium]|nr:M24 family metallopeptidase C-terminal domain-containing protein [Lachnospiraceae bacterium]